MCFSMFRHKVRNEVVFIIEENEENKENVFFILTNR